MTSNNGLKDCYKWRLKLIFVRFVYINMYQGGHACDLS